MTPNKKQIQILKRQNKGPVLKGLGARVASADTA